MKKLILIVGLLRPLAGHAQGYSVNWLAIAGGGGTSTGGVYAVTTTIGQSIAGSALTGGSDAVTTGFWSLFAVQTPGAPVLSITLTATKTAMVYWPSPSASYILEVNTDLTTTNWVASSDTVTDNGTIRFIIVNPPSGHRYYRLQHP
jgi:hypothetical protein